MSLLLHLRPGVQHYHPVHRKFIDLWTLPRSGQHLDGVLVSIDYACCDITRETMPFLRQCRQLDYYMSCHYRTASFIHSSRCEGEFCVALKVNSRYHTRACVSAAWRSTKGKKSQKGKKGAPDAPLPPPPPAINLLILEVKRALARGSIFVRRLIPCGSVLS